jgi:hypothetical protein
MTTYKQYFMVCRTLHQIHLLETSMAQTVADHVSDMAFGQKSRALTRPWSRSLARVWRGPKGFNAYALGWVKNSRVSWEERKKERKTIIRQSDVNLSLLALPCSGIPLMQNGVCRLPWVGNMPCHIRKSSVSKWLTMWLLQRHQMVMPT